MPKKTQTIDVDDPVGSIERLHPSRVFSFGLWHELRTGYRDTAQTCISNQKFGTGKCWVEIYGPDTVPDAFRINADDTVHAAKFVLTCITAPLTQASRSSESACIYRGDIKGELFLPWAYIGQMLICPGRATSPMVNTRGEKHRFDKKDTWHYMSAFFDVQPTVIYFHVWPSEVRKFYAEVRNSTPLYPENDHATPIR